MSGEQVKGADGKSITVQPYKKIVITGKDGKSTLTVWDVDRDGRFDNHDAAQLKGDASVFSKSDFTKLGYIKTVIQDATVEGQSKTYEDVTIQDGKIVTGDDNKLNNLGSIMDYYGVCDCDSDKKDEEKKDTDKTGQNNNFFNPMGGCCGGFPFMGGMGFPGSTVSLDWGKYSTGAPCITGMLSSMMLPGLLGMNGMGIGLSSMLPCSVAGVWDTVGTWFKKCSTKPSDSSGGSGKNQGGKGTTSVEEGEGALPGEGSKVEPPKIVVKTGEGDLTDDPADKVTKPDPPESHKNKFLGEAPLKSFNGMDKNDNKMTTEIAQKYEIGGKIYYIYWSEDRKTCLSVRDSKGETLNLVAERPEGWDNKFPYDQDAFELVETKAKKPEAKKTQSSEQTARNEFLERVIWGNPQHRLLK